MSSDFFKAATSDSRLRADGEPPGRSPPRYCRSSVANSITHPLALASASVRMTSSSRRTYSAAKYSPVRSASLREARPRAMKACWAWRTGPYGFLYEA